MNNSTLQRKAFTLIGITILFLIGLRIYRSNLIDSVKKVVARKHSQSGPSRPSVIDTVKQTRYLWRNPSAALGWNNVRIVLEGSVNQATLLNRTYILPPFVWMRSCLVGDNACDKASTVPPAESGQQKWAIPIEYVIDVPHLTKVLPVITWFDFWKSHGANMSDPKIVKRPRETKFYYEMLPSSMSHHIERQNPKFKSHSYVNEFPATYTQPDQPSNAGPLQFDSRGMSKSMQLSEAQIYITKYPHTMILYSHDSIFYHHSIGERIVQVGLKSKVFSWRGEYSGFDQDVLGLEAQMIKHFKAGFVYYRSPEDRSVFENITLYGLRPALPCSRFGDILAMRMAQLVPSGNFVAIHIRRGDMTKHKFGGLGSWGATMRMTKLQLQHARDALRQLDLEVTDQDKFFVSTDASDPAQLAELRALGAVLTQDLHDESEMASVPGAAMFNDVRGIISQVIMSNAAFFAGSIVSSFSGGVINQRLAKGKSPKTSKLWHSVAKVVGKI